MPYRMIRTLTIAGMIGVAGLTATATAAADTVIEPGTEAGAYCTVISPAGDATQLHSAAECLQARVSARMEERREEQRAEREQAQADRADARRADR
ncbi:hypothetical protein [Rhodococcus sovatensis]|uniref:Secreted protein n=1 Tax=Rhodococcus sovatensis TaxID=1805840 RepID=A0ABZ2PKE2_9NOCA